MKLLLVYVSKFISMIAFTLDFYISSIFADNIDMLETCLCWSSLYTWCRSSLLALNCYALICSYCWKNYLFWRNMGYSFTFTFILSLIVYTGWSGCCGWIEKCHWKTRSRYAHNSSGNWIFNQVIAFLVKFFWSIIISLFVDSGLTCSAFLL